MALGKYQCTISDEMIESLVISEPIYPVKKKLNDNPLPSIKPAKEDTQSKLENIVRESTNSSIISSNKRSYQGMPQIDKFNQRYKEGIQKRLKKYGFSSIQSVFQTKYVCKNPLGRR